jgi:hypothetical protein
MSRETSISLRPPVIAWVAGIRDRMFSEYIRDIVMSPSFASAPHFECHGTAVVYRLSLIGDSARVFDKIAPTQRSRMVCSAIAQRAAGVLNARVTLMVRADFAEAERVRQANNGTFTETYRQRCIALGVYGELATIERELHFMPEIPNVSLFEVATGATPVP